MKIIPRGGMWQVHFTDQHGERQRLSTKIRVNNTIPDKGKAMATMAAIDLVRAHLMGTEAGKPEAASRTRTLGYALRRTLDERWSAQKSGAEKHYVVSKLIREVGWWPMGSITYTRLHEFGQELAARGDSPATRNRKMSAIHTAMSDAQRRGEIEALPPFPHWAENNLKERYLLREEEVVLLRSMAQRAAPGDEEAQLMLAMVPFLLDTGLRAGEAFLGPTQDQGDRIWLPHGTTKSGRGRTVPLTSRARECLTSMRALPLYDELLKRHAKNPDWTTNWMGRRFRTECKHAKVDGVTLHTLRHTCASRLVQAGVSLYTVKEWLGHSSITITERYAHLAPKNLMAAVGALEDAPAVPLASTENDTPRPPKGTVH